MNEMIAVLVGIAIGSLVRYDQVRRLREENYYARLHVERVDQVIEVKDRWRGLATRLWARVSA